MKKWIIGLSILCATPSINLEAQVYNQKFDKRFSNEIHSAEHYQKHIQKLQKRLYSDYHNFLNELNFSTAYNRIELMRQDRIKRLEAIRTDLNQKIDYDQQFNDAKHEINRDFNILIDRYLALYKTEIKTNVQLVSNKIDSLGEYKSLYNAIKPLVEKASHARLSFEEKFGDLEETYTIGIENKDEIEEYSPIQKKIYILGDKISHIESLTLYSTYINLNLILLETIDKDFRAAAKDLNEDEMSNIIRYQKNNSLEIFNKFSKLEKYNETENELKSNALRVVKNYLSNSSKIYLSILKFSKDNRRVLIQERKNKEEYEAVIKDKGSFKSREDYKAYVANTPSQKYSEKYSALVTKYREKTESSILQYEQSLQELVFKYIKEYNPINENF